MATVRFKRTTSDKLRVYYDELKFNDTPYRYTTLSLVGNLLTIHNNIDPNPINITVDWADVTFPVTASAIDLQKTIQGWINEGTKEVRNISDFIIEIDDAPEQLPCDNRLYSINGDLWWNCQLVAISGGGGNPVCIQSGTADGQILVWDNTLQCWELGTLSAACVEVGTQNGNTLYWNDTDQCWNETETIRHAELNTLTVTNGGDRNGVFISEVDSTMGADAKLATIANSGGSFINAVAAHIDSSYLSKIDNTNNLGGQFSSIDNSVFCDITDVWSVNGIRNSAGAQITGFTPGNEQTGTGRMILLGAGVDINDLINGRRLRIEGSGQLQSIVSSAVDIFATNSSLVISNDGRMQSMYNCLVKENNTNAGIFGTGENQVVINCLNPIVNTNAEGVTVIGLQDPNITSLQPYTMYYPTERSFGGKQYKIDEVNVDTFLDFFNHYVSVDTTTPVILTLPATPINGQTYVIFDNLGSASTNNITIDGGTKTINSPDTQNTTYIIDGDYSGITITYDIVTDKWHLISSAVSAGSTTCVNVGTAQGNTDVWNNSSLCWEETQAVRIATIASSFSNSGTDKEGVFISDNNSTFGVTANTSAIIACDTSVCNIKYGLLVGSNSCTLSTNTSSERNFIICCSSTNVGAAFGSDGSKNGAMLCDSYSLGAGNNNLSYSNQFSAQALNTFTVLGQGSNLQLQGNRFAFASGEDNVSTNTRNSNNIGGRHQLINHNANAGKDNTILNSPYTALNSSAVVDFTDIIAYMDGERTATNYTDNISVGGGGNIVKGGAGGAFGNGFFNSFANYVDTPVSTFAPGQIFGVNCFINSQECQLDNAFGDTAFCTFINCWQSGIINGSVSSPFVANNTIIGGGVGVGTSGSTWINGGALTESGGGVSIHGAGSQNSAVQCIQIGARGVSNIDSSNTSIQLNVNSSYINNGSVNCGQFNASNCLADNSESSGSMYVVLSGVGSNLGMVRVIDSLASSHCNIFTNDTATYVDLTDCEASGIRDCKFNGTLGEPNYLPAGGSWGLVNATTKSAQSMIACYNTTAEVGNNCVVMTQNGTNFTDTQDNKLHVATTRHIGGEQRKVSVYTTGTNLLTYEEHIIIADDCTVQLPTTPIDGQEYYVRHFNSTGGNDVVVDGNGINIRVGNANSATDTLVGGTDTMIHLVYSSVKALWIAIIKA